MTAQLINVADGYHLWSETYDRKYEDIFKIQDEIAGSILGALRVHLLGEEAAPAIAHQPAEQTVNMDAYSAYLIGKERLAKRTREDIEAAVEKFTQALNFDENYAPAHAHLAHALLLLGERGFGGGEDDPDDVDAMVLPHLNKALALAPDLPEAVAINGYHHMPLEPHRNGYATYGGNH